MSSNLLHFIGHQCKLILHQSSGYGLFHNHAWILRVGCWACEWNYIFNWSIVIDWKLNRLIFLLLLLLRLSTEVRAFQIHIRYVYTIWHVCIMNCTWIGFLPLAAYLFTISFISFNFLRSGHGHYFAHQLVKILTEVLSFDMDCKFSSSISEQNLKYTWMLMILLEKCESKTRHRFTDTLLLFTHHFRWNVNARASICVSVFAIENRAILV